MTLSSARLVGSSTLRETRLNCGNHLPVNEMRPRSPWKGYRICLSQRINQQQTGLSGRLYRHAVSTLAANAFSRHLAIPANCRAGGGHQGLPTRSRRLIFVPAVFGAL